MTSFLNQTLPIFVIHSDFSNTNCCQSNDDNFVIKKQCIDYRPTDVHQKSKYYGLKFFKVFLFLLIDPQTFL